MFYVFMDLSEHMSYFEPLLSGSESSILYHSKQLEAEYFGILYWDNGTALLRGFAGLAVFIGDRYTSQI